MAGGPVAGYVGSCLWLVGTQVTTLKESRRATRRLGEAQVVATADTQGIVYLADAAGRECIKVLLCTQAA